MFRQCFMSREFFWNTLSSYINRINLRFNPKALLTLKSDSAINASFSTILEKSITQELKNPKSASKSLFFRTLLMQLQREPPTQHRPPTMNKRPLRLINRPPTLIRQFCIMHIFFKYELFHLSRFLTIRFCQCSFSVLLGWANAIKMRDQHKY